MNDGTCYVKMEREKKLIVPVDCTGMVIEISVNQRSILSVVDVSFH